MTTRVAGLPASAVTLQNGWGWLCDFDTFAPVVIHIYAGGSAGAANAKFVLAVTANQDRADLVLPMNMWTQNFCGWSVWRATRQCATKERHFGC